ncbi:hypothetical protein ACFSND_27980 [Brevibacillus brevis]|uniref:hypothetical protein n=1 Tax=Brevibacillus brevis TaxID=1393 RepID=UPI0036442E13
MPWELNSDVDGWAAAPYFWRERGGNETMIYDLTTGGAGSIQSEWENGVKRTLLVLPTGCGKTIGFSKVIEDR